ncbi:MAG: MBL fold metallo-hydrolase, partial [Thermoplasmatota archaeon]
TGEITDVFLTHYHLDHLLNVGLFPHARISCGQYTLHGARGLSHHGAPYGPDLEVLPTPGHTPGHASLLVSTPEGLVAVAGDVIWYPAESLEEACSLPDPYAHDRRLLQESRMLLWKKAAVIVPGHGPAFSP